MPPDIELRIKMKVDIDVDGVVAAVREAADPQLQAIAFEVESEAKRSMRSGNVSRPGQPPGVVTGNLRRNIKTEKSEIGTYLVGPTKAAPYGALLEFIKNRPFMRPALEKVRARFVAFFKNLPLARTRTGTKLNGRKLKR